MKILNKRYEFITLDVYEKEDTLLKIKDKILETYKTSNNIDYIEIGVICHEDFYDHNQHCNYQTLNVEILIYEVI